MELKREVRFGAVLGVVFAAAYWTPLTNPRVSNAILEGFKLLQWYVRNHTLACVVPAIFIAGAISTFLSQASVMRHLGPKSPKVKAYGVASVSGSVLAVCSCSVLPMFAGIYRLGAGLGPASAFLYSGPAINVLAIFLTARVLGFDLGVWRAVGAVVFAVLIGIGMALVFRREEATKAAAAPVFPDEGATARPLWKNGVFLGCLVAFLVFTDWYNPGDAVVRLADGPSVRGVVLQETVDEITVQVQETSPRARAGDRLVLPKTQVAGVDQAGGWVIDVYVARWWIAGAIGLLVLWMTFRWFDRDERRQWMASSWEFARMLVPLLFGGVLLVGFLAALLPEQGVAGLVGDNSVLSVLGASLVGALFYFATLTEIPIVQALLDHGMAKGPALALLLAGPALSLPNILVIAKVIGWKKTLVFSGLVVGLSTVAGLVYGALP